MNADEIVRKLRAWKGTVSTPGVEPLMLKAADEINHLKAEIFGQADLIESLQAQLAAAQRRADAAVELAGKLVALCDPPKEWQDKLFCRHVNRPGVYMGSGYDFLDSFYKLFDDFTEAADEETYRAVQSVAEKEFAKWRGSKGTGEGEQGERS